MHKGFNQGLKMLLVCLIAFTPLCYGITPQKSRTNQKKIEREQDRKKRQAQKKYDSAIKRHQRIQTKETRARMKQSKRASPKATPIRP
jgi:hypothetical protein